MGKNQNNKIIGLLFFGVLMGALDISIVGPAIPLIEQTLHISSRESGLIFSSYVLFNLIGISLFARLSDKFGRRNIYIIALSIFAFGSLIVSFIHDFNWLIVGRAIQGFGASGIFPVASALVGDLFPVDKRGRILGLIGAVFGLAFLLGPFIAGFLLSYFSWNFLFIINLPIAAVLIFFSFKILPSQSIVKNIKMDWRGIIVLGIALAAFTYGMNSINGYNLSSFIQLKVMIPFIIAASAFIFLILSEKHIEYPILKLSFFKNSQILIAGVLAVVTGLIQACFVFIPKFVIHEFQVEPSTASFMLTPFVLATAVGSPLFGRMIDKIGVKWVVIIGLSFLSLGFFFLSQVDGRLGFYYISGAFVGLGLSILSGSSLRYILLNNTSAEDRSTSQGLITIFTSVGQIAGSALIGILLTSTTNGFHLNFVGIAIITAGMLLVSLKLKNR
ncbi:MAG TPA: MFS transporter [Bacteroidales bacterium]|nr:MFS transporter [Bacteroidales bacterium]HPS70934.1 MFS transporter [Bacteroidales bacterium]